MKQCPGQLSMFSVEASHDRVSLSPLPGSKEARMMTVTSGRKCSELYGNSGPLGSLVRMCLESSIWHSTRCYLTWKTKDLPHNRLLFRLAVSMPRTSETECALWPTPTTGAPFVVGSRTYEVLKQMERKGLITEEERRSFAAGNGGKTNPEFLEWLMGYQKAFTGLIPTPRSSEWKGAKLNRFIGGGCYRHQLMELLECSPRGRIGWTNPTYLEWLTGYPIGWTELNVSEMQSSRSSSTSSLN